MLIPYDVMYPASSGGRRKWGRMKCTATLMVIMGKCGDCLESGVAQAPIPSHMNTQTTVYGSVHGGSSNHNVFHVP